MVSVRILGKFLAPREICNVQSWWSDIFYTGLFCICFQTLLKKSSNPKVCELHASKWTHLMSVVMQSIYRKAFQGRSVNSADVQRQGQRARGKKRCSDLALSVACSVSRFVNNQFVSLLLLFRRPCKRTGNIINAW